MALSVSAFPSPPAGIRQPTPDINAETPMQACRQVRKLPSLQRLFCKNSSPSKSPIDRDASPRSGSSSSPHPTPSPSTSGLRRSPVSQRPAAGPPGLRDPHSSPHVPSNTKSDVPRLDIRSSPAESTISSVPHPKQAVRRRITDETRGSGPSRIPRSVQRSTASGRGNVNRSFISTGNSSNPIHVPRAPLVFPNQTLPSSVPKRPTEGDPSSIWATLNLTTTPRGHVRPLPSDTPSHSHNFARSEHPVSRAAGSAVRARFDSHMVPGWFPYQTAPTKMRHQSPLYQVHQHGHLRPLDEGPGRLHSTSRGRRLRPQRIACRPAVLQPISTRRPPPTPTSTSEPPSPCPSSYHLDHTSPPTLSLHDFDFDPSLFFNFLPDDYETAVPLTPVESSDDDMPSVGCGDVRLEPRTANSVRELYEYAEKDWDMQGTSPSGHGNGCLDVAGSGNQMAEFEPRSQNSAAVDHAITPAQWLADMWDHSSLVSKSPSTVRYAFPSCSERSSMDTISTISRSPSPRRRIRPRITDSVANLSPKRDVGLGIYTNANGPVHHRLPSPSPPDPGGSNCAIPSGSALGDLPPPTSRSWYNHLTTSSRERISPISRENTEDGPTNRPALLRAETTPVPNGNGNEHGASCGLGKMRMPPQQFVQHQTLASPNIGDGKWSEMWSEVPEGKGREYTQTGVEEWYADHVVVKTTQSQEGVWQEKAVRDIIPKLRRLKVSPPSKKR